MEFLLKELFPLNRSLTGKGNRETLKILNEIIPLEIHEIPSGKKVYDWTIPKEWSVKKAYIKNVKGENTKIILTGDIEQIDSVYLDSTSNGLSYAVEKFKFHELSGHVTLVKGERSKVATLASKIL